MSNSEAPNLPEEILELGEKYVDTSEYEKDYTMQFDTLSEEQQLLVILLVNYPEYRDPNSLIESTRYPTGSIYPHIRYMKQEDILRRKEGEYRLRWTPKTEQKIRDELN